MRRDTHVAPDGAEGFRFQRACFYLNTLSLDVVAPDRSRHQVEFRAGLSDYEASIYNGGADAYRKACEPLVGVLYRVSDPLPAGIVEAFNAWQRAAHDSSLAFMRARPERYGAESEWADAISPPLQARAAASYLGGAWVFAPLNAERAKLEA